MTCCWDSLFDISWITVNRRDQIWGFRILENISISKWFESECVVMLPGLPQCKKVKITHFETDFFFQLTHSYHRFSKTTHQSQEQLVSLKVMWRKTMLIFHLWILDTCLFQSFSSIHMTTRKDPFERESSHCHRSSSDQNCIVTFNNNANTNSHLLVCFCKFGSEETSEIWDPKLSQSKIKRVS
jgi:hypothetical protein